MRHPLELWIGLRYTRAKRRNHFISFISLVSMLGIAIAQIGALVWGFYAVHSQRPVAVSYYEGAFASMTAEPLAIEKKPADYAEQFSDLRPPLVFVREPVGDEEGARAAMQEVIGTVGGGEDPFFFERFEPHWAKDVLPHAASVGARSKERPEFGEALPGFLARHGGAAADYAFFAYNGREGECTLAFRRATGEQVDALGCRKY